MPLYRITITSWFDVYRTFAKRCVDIGSRASRTQAVLSPYNFPVSPYLSFQREEVNRSLLRDEEEKAKIQRDLAKMTERLAKLNEELARKMQARVEFDQTIQETEAAYMKILESSSTLLGVLKRESTNLKKTATSSRT